MKTARIADLKRRSGTESGKWPWVCSKLKCKGADIGCQPGGADARSSNRLVARGKLHMSKQTYPMLAVALASLLVAPPLSAFAQREQGPQGARSAPNKGALPRGGARVVPRSGARLPHSPLRTQNFGGHAYHGRLAWRQGRWHHATRNGRNGWWWDVGDVWYFYSEQVEGPPDYVSDIEVADNEHRGGGRCNHRLFAPDTSKTPLCFVLSPGRFFRHPLSDIRRMFSDQGKSR